MNDISDYIQGELIKTPFNLYNLIAKYIESNNNTKVAFVGGYLRDLLISKFHKKSFSKPVDIDLVIEGSSISLAKFIKKNIVNVDLCLIKEFNLYNTVEININDYKIDIASARKEIYSAPGLNPTVNKSTIEEDLKRRDFTINSIAFEVSTRKIYDLYGGISDIKSKRLNLLHSNSISDDPSRLIRCAKYASRLDFNISNNSLKQSQETVRQWPWKSSETHQKMIYPPALGIRIRMELAEICKHDNLTNVISIIHKWEIISILNENIKVDKRFLRGLNWIKKLKGNHMLYLLKDSEDLEKAFPQGAIDWMGFLSTDELQKELGKCRGLLNTPKWNEAYGNVIVEALACGVPVVAYKRGGPSEIIQHGQTGYLADPDDKKNMLSYVEIIEKIKRQKCREWVEKNASADIFANKVVNWLNKVMHEYK